MAHTAYLTLRGAKQGLISGGCNTKDSMGNRYQENHTDQITVLACHFSVRKEPHQHGLSRDSVHITKHIDKATPLLATAFARQEYLEGSIDFYRTNEKGYNEKFYSIALQKAVISGINSDSPHAVLAHDQEMNETISLRYKGMQLEHLLCGTMASDSWVSDNALSVMQGYQDVLARKPTPANTQSQEKVKEKAESQIKTPVKSVVRLVISDKVTGYTIQNLKGLSYVFSQPAVVVPTYEVKVLSLELDHDDVISEQYEFSFNITRDAWYFLGKKENGENAFLNRAFIPANYKQNLYTAYWIPSYPNPISATYLPSGLDAFVFTRFGDRAIPAKPLSTQKNIDGSGIDHPRANPNIVTDVMIHVGSVYEVLKWDYLGGSYGCFGFIPKNDIYATPEDAEQAVYDDDYDDETSNGPWMKTADKIINLAFPEKKSIQILLEPRDESKNLIPDKILEE